VKLNCATREMKDEFCANSESRKCKHFNATTGPQPADVLMQMALGFMATAALGCVVELELRSS